MVRGSDFLNPSSNTHISEKSTSDICMEYPYHHRRHRHQKYDDDPHVSQSWMYPKTLYDDRKLNRVVCDTPQTPSLSYPYKISNACNRKENLHRDDTLFEPQAHLSNHPLPPPSCNDMDHTYHRHGFNHTRINTDTDPTNIDSDYIYQRRCPDENNTHSTAWRNKYRVDKQKRNILSRLSNKLCHRDDTSSIDTVQSTKQSESRDQNTDDMSKRGGEGGEKKGGSKTPKIVNIVLLSAVTLLMGLLIYKLVTTMKTTERKKKNQKRKQQRRKLQSLLERSTDTSSSSSSSSTITPSTPSLNSKPLQDSYFFPEMNDDDDDDDNIDTKKWNRKDQNTLDTTKYTRETESKHINRSGDNDDKQQQPIANKSQQKYEIPIERLYTWLDDDNDTFLENTHITCFKTTGKCTITCDTRYYDFDPERGLCVPKSNTPIPKSSSSSSSSLKHNILQDTSPKYENTELGDKRVPVNMMKHIEKDNFISENMMSPQTPIETQSEKKRGILKNINLLEKNSTAVARGKDRIAATDNNIKSMDDRRNTQRVSCRNKILDIVTQAVDIPTPRNPEHSSSSPLYNDVAKYTRNPNPLDSDSKIPLINFRI